MNQVVALAVICAGFMASPALAQDSCIPKELRDSFDALRTSGSEELKAANEKLEKARGADSLAQAKDKAKSALRVASEKVKEAEIKVKTLAAMAEPFGNLAPCALHLSLAPDMGLATRTPVQPPGAEAHAQTAFAAQLADLRNSVKWNQKLLTFLIFLIFLVMTAIVLLYVSLQTFAKRINEAVAAQTDHILRIRARNPSPAMAETDAAAASPKASGQSLKSESGAHAAESMQRSAGKASPKQPPTALSPGSGPRIPQQAHDQGGQAHVSPSQGPLISNGNTQYAVAAKAKTAPESLFFEDDVDGQLSESEIWPILLPIAGNLVAAVQNLDSASLTRELMKEIEHSRPSLALRIRSLGFQAISGRLAPDGRETSRFPEMFAVEMAGRILLFPSPRSNYKSSFDAYFEGATTENWRECIQPARVQKTGDNLLSVIDRGISGR